MEHIRKSKPVKYDITISNHLMDCRIFWARVVSSETESLFTQYTKHTFFELQYALKGYITVKSEQNKTIRVDESDFIIIPPDAYHQIVDADKNGTRFIMGFSLTPKVDSIKRILHSISQPVPYRESSHMRALIEIIISKATKGGAIRKQLTTSLLESFLLEIFENIYAPYLLASSEKSESESSVFAMKEYIKNSSGIGIQVRDLSKKFNMSQRHINRIFNAAVGESPKEYINHEKLKKIEEYVATTDLSLSEISELTGFCDEYAMNKFFKRYNLTNLSDFRKIAKVKKTTGR